MQSQTEQVRKAVKTSPTLIDNEPIGMSGLTYVISHQHIRAAIEKANAEELQSLERIAGLVSEVDHIERTLQERIYKAQSDTATKQLELSTTAMEAISQSDDASREIDRLLTRKCHRADSASSVVKEVLNIARLDMREANALDNGLAEGDPIKWIYTERYRKRRELVKSLQAFIADYG